MNIAKNMEAVFVATVILAGVATYATAKVNPVAVPAPAAKVATQERMVTIVVTTKRLTAAQKAALDS
jgi:hypothetical protein